MKPTLSTKVAKAENTLPISDDNASHIMLWPVLQHLINVSSIVDRDEEALRIFWHKNMGNFLWLINLWLFESKTKLLAGKAHGGGVDNRHQLLRVLCQQLVEELLVSLQQLDLSRQMKSVTVLGEKCAHHVHVLIEGVG